MEPASKLTVIGVMSAVLILLIIGLHKEDWPLKSDSQTSQYELKVREPEISTPMFYLVVGSFQELENANSFGESFKFKNHELYILPRTDGYIRVGIFSSPHRDAVEEYKKISSQDFPKSWITYQ